MKILVTGGAGYIGSHFVKFMNNGDNEITVIDNLSRGYKQAIPKNVKFFHIGIEEYDKLISILQNNNFDVVVHFAAYAYVGESVEKPDIYYENNVIGSYKLIKAAAVSGIKKFVFSSTCSVYGNPVNIPISEEQYPIPINPYAKSKLIIESMLKDFESSHGMNYISLRYFNAAGCDFEGSIGESHNPEPHLIPNVLLASLGKKKLYIYGNDYPTPDGTCIRDYVHVVDLSEAHYKAIKLLNKENKSYIINLGSGRGYSNLEILRVSEEIAKTRIPFTFSERRKGDPAILIADIKKAAELLNWKPKYNLYDIITTAYLWLKNPKY
ncbi:UDP-glucose 4-epimerase GalE [Melioribacteraceae bacterium 4301-Me]|uniref:UDP-glucose 4-epimerase GalE n=1 Tax=Pyranulibacter aquaticus TaxID=3163344 RepID=UPI003595A9E0